MGGLILIDDRDPAIQYTRGTWIVAGVKEEFNSTSHGSADDGAQAILTFTGTSVAIYGTLLQPHTTAFSTYIIDGSSTDTAMAPTSTLTLYRHLFYQSRQLKNGEHTLIITSTVPAGVFWLDYFAITPNQLEATRSPISTPQVPVTQPIRAPSTTRLINNTVTVITQGSPDITYPSQLSVTVTTTSTTTPTPPTPNSIPGLRFNTTTFTPILHPSTSDTTLPTQSSLAAPRTKSPPWAAIIAGSVVGGLLLFLGIAYAIWRSRKRRNIVDTTITPMEGPRVDAISVSILRHDPRRFHKPRVVVSRRSFTPSQDAPPEYVEYIPPVA